MTKKLYWLKRTAIKQDARKVYVLQKGALYYVIWELLEDVAASINDEGKIYVSPAVPVDMELLASWIGQKKKSLENTLDILESIDVIARDEQGFIRLLTWDTIQDFHKQEKIREQTKQRVAKYRCRQAEQAQHKDTKDDDISSDEMDDASKSIQLYQSYWGQVNPVIAKKLTEMVEDWGCDAVCKAIDIAKEMGKHHINYIQAVLVNSNGQPERKESAHATWKREFNQCLNAVLYEDREPDKSRQTETYEGSFAGYDRRPEPRPQSALAPAL